MTALEPIQSRDYQNHVVDKSVGFFEAGESSVLIESPTGSGKSVMGLRICQRLAEMYGWRANWIAMRRNLLRQISDMNARFFGLEGLTPVSMFEKDPPQAEITVVDEAQHDAAASCAHIHARSGSRIILGLSATPYRTDRLKLAFRRVVRDAGIHRLITEGWLAPFEHWSVDNWDVAHVASVYLCERAKWGKTVAFFHRVEQCLEFAAILAGAGRHCEVITADTDRESQLDDFEAGRFDVVANVAILNEGFDCPSLRTVFVRDASKLPTIQMAGRAFRQSPETGKTHCNVVQSGHARWQFTRTARPRQSHALRGGLWVTLGNSVRIDEVARETMGRISAIEVAMPKYLGAEAQKKRRGAARGWGGRRRRFQREPGPGWWTRRHDMPMPITTFSIVVGSEACNAKCRFCVSAMTGFAELPACRRINKARFAKAARLAQLGNTTTALLTGKGEPTLYPDEITEYLLLLKPFLFPFIEVQTNALLLGRLAAGGNSGKLTEATLRNWLELGLNTVAISVVGVRPEHNRAVYAADYPDLAVTIAYLHRAGFSVRLCVMMHKGFVDRPEALEEVVAFCKANGVEQLTARPIRRPRRSASGKHAEYTRTHGDSQVRAIRRWADGSWWRRGRGTKILTMRHGDQAMATVYDVDGQNLALSDCLTVGSTSDALRTLIFYSDGRLTYDWQYGGARLL